MSLDFFPITPIFGARLTGYNYSQLMSATKASWKNLLYDRNIIIIENISLDRKQLVEFSFKLGCPWLKTLYQLHGESIEADGVVNWSDKTGIKKKSLPWHTDNSWHPIWRNPIRVLYGKQIPDPGSGVIHYLNLSYVFNHLLSNEEKNWLSQFKVLIQDYRQKERKFWYPLVKNNPINGRKSLCITAMDYNSKIFGLQKESDYEKGNTFLLKVANSLGEELSLQYLSEYIQKSMNIDDCYFHQHWTPNMIQIISNLDSVHLRTRISNNDTERVIWRKTIAHDYQVKNFKEKKYVAI